MKDHFNSFVLVDVKNEIVLKDLSQIFNELLSNMDLSYMINEDDGLEIIFNHDINEDIVEALESLLQDFDERTSLFVGFRVRNLDYIKTIHNLFKKYHFKSILRSADLLNKLDKEELLTVKPILLDKLMKDQFLSQIVKGMFDSNLNISKTAQQVYMHRNSVNNKLDLIQKETGLDIQKFYDAVALFNIMK